MFRLIHSAACPADQASFQDLFNCRSQLGRSVPRLLPGLRQERMSEGRELPRTRGTGTIPEG